MGQNSLSRGKKETDLGQCYHDQPPQWKWGVFLPPLDGSGVQQKRKQQICISSERGDNSDHHNMQSRPTV